MIKLSDYVARRLADAGVRHVFLITGGGAMHLNDSFGSEPRLRVVCQHHEQACAMAAEGYARVSGEIGVVNVTTGPGGINALNGVFGAWTDSVPLLVVSGQVKRETCMSSYPSLTLRQLGDQEADIVRIVRGITKYAVQVTDPKTVRYHLDRALRLATTGRPGPCWIDIPVDVQASLVDPDALAPYREGEDPVPGNLAALPQLCQDLLRRLERSSRPVILAGTGVRAAKALALFQRVIRRLGIPVTTAWTHDLIASDDPLFCGRPGTIGTRAGNFTVQNADTLLVLGSRLNIRQVSYNWPSFARHAFKIQVDVDAAEMNKPTVRPDLAVHADLAAFLVELDRAIDQTGFDAARHADWLKWCRDRQNRYPAVLPRHRVFSGRINPYHFMEVLFDRLAEDDVVISGNATACIVAFQAARLRPGQRLISNSGSASMGHDLPASIGAAFARGGGRVVCLAGDGSLQLNLQELQTVVHHRLPIKIFVLNNDGYLSIRSTQSSFFGRLVGESPASGVSFPDMVKVGEAYGIPSVRLDQADFGPMVERVLAADGPVLCEVILDPAQPFEPKLSSRQLPDGRIVSAPLEDMFPFLDREELLANLKIPPAEP